MALPAPNLDDRRFDDLFDDARRLVQSRCPEWTDHNASDPGVTLIETFAFLVDQLLYRLNRMPDRLHIKFLDLIGVRMYPPTPARTDTTFWLSGPAATELTIPAGTEVGTLRTDSVESVIFTTLSDLDILPCEMVAARTRRVGEQTSVDRTNEVSAGVAFSAFSDIPMPGDELLVALDKPVPRCAVRVDLDGQMEGLGIDPDNPPLVWEAFDGDAWVPCVVLKDETGGLNRAGGIVLDVIADHVASLVDGQRGAWLRCRIVETDDDQPRYSGSPIIDRIDASTVGVTGEVVNAEIVEDEEIGTTEGVAGQIFRVLSHPVLSGLSDPVVEVSSEDGWLTWTRVEHFANSTHTDRHFTLDSYTGEVAFGPVVRLPAGGVQHYGAVPPSGETVRIRSYAVGGGASGNVAAGTITTLRSSIPFVAEVSNMRSAHGGVDAETVDQARERGALTLRTRSRAVTAEDYEILSKQAVPEAARVRCITAGDTNLPTGMVKVLVVPAASAVDGKVELADLVPSKQMLARLAEYLDTVRLIGTKVLVEPPRYRGITVVARLIARPRVKIARVEEEALRAVTTFLSPLPGGGPDGEGWPFGRAVRVGDIHTILQRVQGVDAVEDVRLFSANPVTGQRGAETNKVELEPNSLVFSFDHQIRAEAQ